MVDFRPVKKGVNFRPLSVSNDPYHGLDSQDAKDKSSRMYDVATQHEVPFTDVEKLSQDIDEIDIHSILAQPAPKIIESSFVGGGFTALQTTKSRQRTEEETIQFNMSKVPNTPRAKYMAKQYLRQRKAQKKIEAEKTAELGDVLDLNMYLAYFAGGEDAAEAIGKANIFRNKPKLADASDNTTGYLADNPNESFVPSVFNVQLDQNRSGEIDMLVDLGDTKKRDEYYRSKGVIGVSEFQERKDGREYMLFSDSLKAIKSGEIRNAINRLQDPGDSYAKSQFTEHGLSPNYDRDLLLMRDHFFKLEEAQARGTTLGATFTDMGLNMAKYMGEIALLSGITSSVAAGATGKSFQLASGTSNLVGRSAAIGLRKLGVTKLIASNVGKLSGATAMALVDPAGVSDLTIGRMTDKGYVGDVGQFIKTEEGQSLMKALPKSIGEKAVTFYIEQVGDDLVKGVFKIGSKVTSKLPRGLVSGLDDVAAYMKRTGVRSFDKLPKGLQGIISSTKTHMNKLLKSGKFDGVFGENVEEYIDQIVKPMLLLDDQYRDKDDAFLDNVVKSLKIDPEQLMLQTALFTIIPFAAGAVGSVPATINWAGQKVGEVVQGQPTLPEVQNRIQLENSLAEEYGFDRKQAFEVADMLDRRTGVDKLQKHIQGFGGDFENFRFTDHNNTKALAAMLVDRGVVPKEALRIAEIVTQKAGEEDATVQEVVQSQDFKNEVERAEKEDTEDVKTEQQGIDEDVETTTAQQAVGKVEGEEKAEPEKEGFVATEETKERGVSKSVEAEAIEKDLVEAFDDVPEYQVVSMEQQGELAGRILTDNPEQAKRIAMGQEAAPPGVIPEMIYIALANKATREGDIDTLKELALNSELIKEATEMGQRIRAYGELGEHSAIKAIQGIIKLREGELDKNEKATRKKLRKDVKKAEKDLAKLEQKLSDKDIDSLISDTIEGKEPTGKVDITSKTYGSKNKGVTKKKKDAALKRLGDTTKLFAGVDPKKLVDVIEVSAFHLEAIGRNLPAWTKAMIDQFGEKVKPHLDRLWKEANKSVAKTQIKGAIEKATKAIGEDRDLTALSPVVDKLARALITQGANTRVKLVSALHKVLQGAVPDLTVRETSEILVRYGQFERLSNEEVEVTLREIRGTQRQLLKLEDMAAGIAPPASGKQRPTASAEERALLKQVAEAKKKGGFDVTDPAKQLKTALAAIKTRLKNQIEDLEKQIKEKKKSVKTKTDPPTDSEVEALRLRKDALKATFDEMFGKSDRTDAQRIESAKKRLQRDIVEINDKIEKGDFARKVKRSTPETIETKTLRHAREKAKRVVDSAREILEQGGGISREEITQIMGLSQQIEFTKTQMEAGERRTTHGKPTSTEMDYGFSVVAFEKYIEVLQHKAQKKAIPQRLKGWLDIRDGALLLDIAGTAKAIRASMDNSFIGRQGIKLFYLGITGDMQAGKIWADTFFGSFKVIVGSLADRNVMDVLRAEILSDPQYDLIRRAKVATAVIEEEFPVHWPGKIPAIGRLFKASEEAFTASAYYMRYKTAKMYFDIAKNTGVDLNDKYELESIGRLVNALTARGGKDSHGKGSTFLNNVIWSPKMIKANFEVFLFQPLNIGGKDAQGRRPFSKFAQKQALRNLWRIILGQAAVLFIANLIWPDSVEKDPTSSDFGKIKIGNTRFDISGGSGSMIVLAMRIAQNRYKSSGGLDKALNSGDYGGLDSSDLVMNFLQNKLSPAAGVVKDMINRKTFDGDPVTPATIAEGLFVPLPFTNLKELIEDPDSAPVLLGMMLESLGVSTLTYKTRRKATR